MQTPEAVHLRSGDAGKQLHHSKSDNQIYGKQQNIEKKSKK